MNKDIANRKFPWGFDIEGLTWAIAIKPYFCTTQPKK
jgi:hypothetical protein